MKSSTATALVAFAAAAISSSTYAAPISEPVPSVNPLAPAPPPVTGSPSAPADGPPGPPGPPPVNPFSGGPPDDSEDGPAGIPSALGSFGPPPKSSPDSGFSNPNILEDANIMQSIRQGIKDGLKVTLSQTLNVPSTDDLVKESEVSEVINCIGTEPLNAMVSCMRDQGLQSQGAYDGPFPSDQSMQLLSCIEPSYLNRMEYCVSKVQVSRLAEDAHIFQQMYNGANLKAQEYAMEHPFLPQPGQEPETEMQKVAKPLFDNHWIDAHKEMLPSKGPSGPGAAFGGPSSLSKGAPMGYDDDLLADMPPPPPPSSSSKGPAALGSMAGGAGSKAGDDDAATAAGGGEDFDQADFLSKLPPPTTPKGGADDFDDAEFLSKLPSPPSSKGPAAGGIDDSADDSELPTPPTSSPDVPADVLAAAPTADAKGDDEEDFDDDYLSKIPPPPPSSKGPAADKSDDDILSKPASKGPTDPKVDAKIDDEEDDFDGEDFLSKLPPPAKGPAGPVKDASADKEDPLSKLPGSAPSGPASDLSDEDDDFVSKLPSPPPPPPPAAEKGPSDAQADLNAAPTDASADANTAPTSPAGGKDAKDAPKDAGKEDGLGDFEDDEDAYLYDDEENYLLPPFEGKSGANATAPADAKLDDVKTTDGAKPALAPVPPFDPKELEALKNAPAPALTKRKFGYGPDWETALGVRDGHPLPRRR